MNEVFNFIVRKNQFIVFNVEFFNFKYNEKAVYKVKLIVIINKKTIY